jgi:hypothetical protein
MRIARGACIISRNDNVLLVDFTRGPEPPAPSFPGASGLREKAIEQGPLRLATTKRMVTAA